MLVLNFLVEICTNAFFSYETGYHIYKNVPTSYIYICTRIHSLYIFKGIDPYHVYYVLLRKWYSLHSFHFVGHSPWLDPCRAGRGPWRRCWRRCRAWWTGPRRGRTRWRPGSPPVCQQTRINIFLWERDGAARGFFFMCLLNMCTLYFFTIYLSLCTPSAERTLFRNLVVIARIFASQADNHNSKKWI